MPLFAFKRQNLNFLIKYKYCSNIMIELLYVSDMSFVSDGWVACWGLGGWSHKQMKNVFNWDHDKIGHLSEVELLENKNGS